MGGKERRGRCFHRDDSFPATPGQIGAQVVRHAPRGDLDEPAPRVVWHALVGPLHRRREQGLLHRVFRGGEITEATEHRAENLRRELAQQVLAGGVQGVSRHMSAGGALMTSRTSIGMFSGTPPFPGAADTRAASS